MAFVQNKSLSDDNDEILRLQGVGWMTRKAISIATLYLDVNHFTEDGIEQIIIDQTITGGIKGTKEHRKFDWVERPHEDHIFGPVLGKSSRFTLDEIEQDWLKQNWLEESFLDGKIIYTRAASDTAKSGKTWSAQQVSQPSAVDLGHPNRHSRPGASSKSMGRSAIPDMYTSLVRTGRSSRTDWYMITVRHHSPLPDFVRRSDSSTTEGPL